MDLKISKKPLKLWMAAAPLLLGSLFTHSVLACSTSAWSRVENPEVTLFARPESRCTGGCGLRIKLNGTQPAYVEDDTPGNLADDVTSYYAKFHLDTTWLNMNDGQKVTVFSTNASGGVPAFGLQVVQVAGKKYAHIFAHRDNGSQIATNSAASELTDGWHTIELMWNASSAAGANDGSLSLALDDVDSVLSLSSLDNDTLAIITAQLGVVSGNDANVTGNLHIDAFTSQRTASTATPEACLTYNQLFTDIPSWHSFYSWIQSIGYASIASGCTATTYCADNNVTRAQMAVFLERGMNGGDYQPPVGTGTQFNDVPASHWADPANHTPRKLAAFWFERSLGYPPDASQIAKAAEMLTHSDEYTGTPWGLDEPIDLSQDEWPHYWQSGLRTLVALILMSPDFLQR